MTKILEQISKLIAVRKLVTLILVVVFVILALSDKVEMTSYQEVLLLVLGYYFGRYTQNTELSATTENSSATSTSLSNQKEAVAENHD